eukprot:6038254-Prymnesium_polylepis.2
MGGGGAQAGRRRVAGGTQAGRRRDAGRDPACGFVTRHVRPCGSKERHTTHGVCRSRSGVRADGMSWPCPSSHPTGVRRLSEYERGCG